MPELQLSQVAVKIDGSDVSPELMTHLLDVTIEKDIDQPSMAVLRFDDHNLEHANGSTFQVGKSIQLDARSAFSANGSGQPSFETVFKGEIVGMEHDFSAQHEATMVVRAFDKLHRLLRGRKRRSFQNVSDSDIVNQIASGHGLQSQVTSTSGTRDWVYQDNLSDWAFLQRLAMRNGFRVMLEDDKLVFRPNDHGTEETHVEWGKSLQSFRSRLSTANQVKKVEVRSWDPNQKSSIVSSASSPQGTPQIGMNTHGGEVATSAFGETKMVIVDRPVESAAAAEHFAQSVLDQISGGFLEADGLMEGNPSLKPGHKVKLDNVGTRFNGSYDVSKVTHFFTPTEGLTTSFQISGKRSNTLLSALGMNELSNPAPLGSGVGVAIVTDIDDPEQLGRVKVKIPWLSDEDQTWWARLVSPMAGRDRGFMFVPEVDDEVLIGFEHGDIQRPFILGALWNGQDDPPIRDAVQGGKSERRVIRTRENHLFAFDDSSGKKSIELKSSKGHYAKIDDVADTIEVKDSNGNYLKIEAGPGNITMQCSGNMKLQCGGNFDLVVTGNMTASITGSTSMTHTGGLTTSVTGTESHTVSGALTITGMTVTIN